MKKAFVAVGLIAATLFLNSCQWQSSVTIAMTHFRLTNESVRLVQGMPISIAIRYEITDENIEVSSVTLAEGQLVDGELALNQKVTEPTEVLISVKVGADGKIAETTAVLKPDSTIDFVLVHTESPNANYYSVQLRGNDHRSIDLNSRFSIIGDLSQLNDFNPELVQVSLRARPSFLDGSGKTIEFDPVLVDEVGFSIEGDLDEPTLFTIEISEHATFLGSFEYLHAIVEPGVNYAVVPLGKEGTYVILSDRGSLHSKLVTSWQFDPEFEALVDTLVANQKIARTGKERKERVEHEKESVRNYRVVAECDHVKLTDKVKSKFIGPYRYAFYSIGDQIVKRRSAALRKVLRDTQDLELARMVFELNWIQFDEDEIISASDTDEKIATLLDLAQKMDQDFVDQFITPQVDSLKFNRKLELTNRSLLPGQVAPEFTLPTVTGDEFSLSEVTRENKLVLVDFWASWCGPCIASFPALKKLYSKNKAHGFEIVTISIDDSFEDWESAADEQKLPWIDLGDTEDGEMKSAFAPTADDYGVLWIPNRFLIDKAGCIVHKHFSDEELEILLTLQ